MERYFVNYNQALSLKELGFDKPCLAFYWNTGKFYTCAEYSHRIESHKQNQLGDYNYDSTSAPLKSQVFEWFREEHNIKGFVEPVEYLDGTPDTYVWFVYNDCHSGTDQLTFDEAESACIDKLIEYVKLK